MGEALKQFHPEDIEVTETRVGRKHEVTAIHKPTGISVIKDGLSFQITRKQALQTLENRLAEEYEENEQSEEDEE
jgi:protein subunit release factor A